MTQSYLNIVGTDFDEIKNNLKQYLKTESGLTDVDFEGSAADVLLDILAYNTFYNNVYLNAATNEAFLKTAVQRSNVVAHANPLGYVPRSMISSRVVGQFEIPHEPSPSDQFLAVPKNYIFTSKIQNRTYRFQTVAETILQSDGSAYVGSGVLHEGAKYSFRYTVDTSKEQSYTIPSADIDTELVTVGIIRGTEFTQYTRKSDLANVTATSKVFWLRENDEGLYEVEFGDSIFGEAEQNGDIVLIEYYISNGAIPNGAREFEAQASVESYSTVNFIPDAPAFGGAIAEDIESIRELAPKTFETQGRAVPWSDYEVLIRSQFPWIESVSAWGGEDNEPPFFGRVMISSKPISGDFLTTTEETEINSYLKERNIGTIIPVFVKPDYIFLKVSSDVRFDYTRSALSISQARTQVENDIFDYIDNTLQKFKASFHLSNLSGLIDDVDGVNSNTTSIQLMKRLQPNLGATNNYIIDFGLELEILKLETTSFTSNLSQYPVFLESSVLASEVTDGKYPVRWFTLGSGQKVVNETPIGTIDYTTGVIQLDNLNIASVPGGLLEFTVTPTTVDIYPERNQLISGREQDIEVNIVPEVKR